MIVITRLDMGSAVRELSVQDNSWSQCVRLPKMYNLTMAKVNVYVLHKPCPIGTIKREAQGA